MLLNEELTIIIPARNAEKSIPNLLCSLVLQDYAKMSNTKVYVADGDSAGRTKEVAVSFAAWLNVETIPGGSPAVGRNLGARRARSRYLLFIDPDVEIYDASLVRRALELARKQSLHCVTAAVSCPEGNFYEHWMCVRENCVQCLSRFFRPRSSGKFLLFDRARFEVLGGFPEDARQGEGYLLTRRVERRRFAVVAGNVLLNKPGGEPRVQPFMPLFRKGPSATKEMILPVDRRYGGSQA
jgi:glycosyltransferase involved in cell wall biosynthesis